MLITLFLGILYAQAPVGELHVSKMLIVEVKEGKLQGVEKKSILTGDAYYAFLGIPYAQPPVGELRFKAPVPSVKWDGVRDASTERDPCVQSSPPGCDAGIFGSEDCLYLNVCTPQPPSDIKQKKAVMVFIHGGGFQNGSGSINEYGPDYLIGHDVICVTLNYRLHVLGFLNAGTESCPGNAGLKDQNLALKWIKRNIASFGGDPQNITIFGESAGGASVHLQMLSPLSKDLFHRAIIQSGSCFAPWALTEGSENGARYIGKLAGYDGPDMEGLVQHLKKQKVETLCELVTGCNEKIQRDFPGRCESVMFIPSIEKIKDGAFLPDLPAILMEDAPRIPLIIGYNNQEGILCVTSQIPKILDAIIADPSIIVKHNFKLSEDEQDELMTRINEFYFENGTWTREGVIKVYTDLFFIKFYVAIEYLVESKVPPYIYFFPYDGTFNSGIIAFREKYHSKLTGAAHGDDLGYMFSLSAGKLKEATEADKEVIKNFTTIWTDFVKNGNPTNSLPQIDWKPHTNSHPCYLSIEEKLTVHPQKLHEERHDFWKPWLSKFVRLVRHNE